MDESEEDEYDEEFEQIDIKKQKREEGDMEEDDAEMLLDDSVSEDKPKKTKRKEYDSEEEYGSEV